MSATASDESHRRRGENSEIGWLVWTMSGEGLRHPTGSTFESPVLRSRWALAVVRAARLLEDLRKAGKANGRRSGSPTERPGDGVVDPSAGQVTIEDRVRVALRLALESPFRWSVKQIASNAGVSVRTLQRATSRWLGVAPAKLLRDARRRTAVAMLQAGGSSMASIARQLGAVDARPLRRLLGQATDRASS